ncbi:DeoR/GlpR family DNA-binding transcription regulator [Streptomyces reniochalinae]|uniref:DeoR/GlpR transcriptional regulator n=1 Tax=Streptomyces reniochalinae TaxID=2250578 RepID=A0A367EBA9_9ACTN|nr:DeoR/GlpR family DNA-binding transcription regulator [Streptomyces reniochalinae]RCG15346.1 DeoR/GlpR transcriptional regulator [Streptomyces reniochalinae]
MKRHERMNALLELLGERGSMEVEEAATALEVSAATTRRDMDALAEQQLLTRTRGGAVLSAVTYDLPIRYKRGHHVGAKQSLARAAAAMVERGSVVGLSGGTTTTEIARALVTRADLAEPSPQPHLTIVTNALNIAYELAVRPQVKTVLTGGVAHSRTFELTGPYSELMLGEITVDIAFIGANGMDPRTGATVHDEAEGRINGLMARHAERAVVVTDSSKAGVRCFARIGGPELFDTFLTDSGLPGPMRRKFEEQGLPTVLAEPDPDEDGGR